MQLDAFRKICSLERLAQVGQEHRQAGRRVVLCHGCFDIVHPGHLRYLQFARGQGDVLVVSLTADDAIEKSDGARPYVPQELRAEALAALEMVDHVVIADDPTAGPVIRALQPALYVKGKEYEASDHPGFLAEKQLVESFGGRVLFGSGEVVFPSSHIIDRLGATRIAQEFDPALRLSACCRRWGIDRAAMGRLIRNGMAGRRVLVVGDALLDRYIFCDAGERSGEAPILTVRPQEEAGYPGGAAVIARHIQGLGGQAHLLTSLGPDAASRELVGQLQAQGIQVHALQARRELPTKIRYLVETQKLLKVDYAPNQPLDSSAQRRLLGILDDLKTQLDAAIFVDFGCGVLSPALVTQSMAILRPHVGTIAGDVSGPRRTLLAFRGADLLTPHERELRSVLGDFDTSLPGVAMNLMRDLGLAHLAVTLDARGCILFRPRETERAHWFENRLRSEYLPSLAASVADPVGAGDALLATMTLALAGEATLAQAGYLGSADAALELARLGNHPVAAADLIQCLRQRPELNETLAAAG